MKRVRVTLGSAFVVAMLLAPLAHGQEAPPSKGDPNRIRWIRPFKEAMNQAKGSQRLVFAKPILGGSNTPKAGGTVAGGKDDCDGSW